MKKNSLLSAEKTAHLYALMAWSDQYTKEQAEEIAFNTEIDELCKITNAKESIFTAISGIINEFEDTRTRRNPTEEDWDTVIKILVKIHNAWVKSNPHKYNRGNVEKSDKKLFQHLPTALIGIDELSLDLMFLAPFLEVMGIHAGEMELVAYGSFKPCQEIVDAYARYVEKYKAKHDITTVEKLSNHIEDCIAGEYEPLACCDEVSQNRIDYMNGNIGLLTMTVTKKNPEAFGTLQMSSHVEC